MKINADHINWQPNHLENELVKLIPLAEADFEILYQVASDPLLWEQHPKKNRYKREVFIRFFEHAISRKSAFLIAEKGTKKIIGSTGYYDYNSDDSSIIVGYTFLARQYWGGTYNIASKKLLLDYAFEYVNKVYFHIGAFNTRSQIAIARIGARKMRTFTTEDKGTEYEYLIERNDWQYKILHTKVLNPKQSEQINELWNNEYPLNLTNRFPLLLQGIEKYNHYLVEDANNNVIAWATDFERENATWFSIIVNSEHKGKGIGKLLIDKLKSESTELYGWVIDHNNDKKMNGENYLSPLPFYVKLDFKILQDIRIDNDMLKAVKIKWKR